MRLPGRFSFGWGAESRLSFASAYLAKRFVIELIEAQAVRDRITLSPVERQMLWFSEADQQGPDGADLEDEESFETKVRGLAARVVKRIRAQNREQYELWTAALKTLKAGDHYLVVLTDVNDDRDRPPHDRLKLWLTALAIVTVITFGGMWLSTMFHFDLTKEEGGSIEWATAAIVVLVMYSTRWVRWTRRRNRVSRKRLED